MRTNKAQKHYRVVVVFGNALTRTVDVKASNLETAERRALKRNPNATHVQKKVSE